MPFLWSFAYKYRGPVQTHIIQADSDPSEAFALELADACLRKHCPNPGARIIPNSLRRWPDYTEAEYRAALAPPPPPLDASDVAASAGRGGSKLGAVDDPASPRRAPRPSA